MWYQIKTESVLIYNDMKNSFYPTCYFPILWECISLGPSNLNQPWAANCQLSLLSRHKSVGNNGKNHTLSHLNQNVWTFIRIFICVFQVLYFI